MADQNLTIEIGNGEGSFVGIKIQPNIKYKLVMKTDVCLANIAQDPTTYHQLSDEEMEKDDDDDDDDGDDDDEDDDDVECVNLIMDGGDHPLHWGNRKDLQARIGLHVLEGDEITLYVRGKGTYYVSGYKNSVNYSID